MSPSVGVTETFSDSKYEQYGTVSATSESFCCSRIVLSGDNAQMDVATLVPPCARFSRFRITHIRASVHASTISVLKRGSGSSGMCCANSMSLPRTSQRIAEFRNNDFSNAAWVERTGEMASAALVDFAVCGREAGLVLLPLLSWLRERLRLLKKEEGVAGLRC